MGVLDTYLSPDRLRIATVTVTMWEESKGQMLINSMSLPWMIKVTLNIQLHVSRPQAGVGREEPLGKGVQHSHSLMYLYT